MKKKIFAVMFCLIIFSEKNIYGNVVLDYIASFFYSKSILEDAGFAPKYLAMESQLSDEQIKVVVELKKGGFSDSDCFEGLQLSLEQAKTAILLKDAGTASIDAINESKNSKEEFSLIKQVNVVPIKDSTQVDSVMPQLPKILINPSYRKNNGSEPYSQSDMMNNDGMIPLYKQGERNKNYYKILQNLKLPAVLKFSDRTFTVTKKLRVGASIILLTDDHKVLRLPVFKVQDKDLIDFVKIYNVVKAKQIPIVNTEYNSNHIEYLLHEFLSIDIHLTDFQKKEVSEQELQDFIDFVALTFDFEYIADTHEGNVVRLNDGRWLIMDAGMSNIDVLKKYKVPYKFFEWNPLHEEKVRSLKKENMSTESIIDEFKKKEWFVEASVNTITDNDPAMAGFLHIPPAWAERIRHAVLAKRIEKVLWLSTNLSDTYQSSKRGLMHILKVNPLDYGIKLVHADDWNFPKSVIDFVGESSAEGGINGGFFNFASENLSWLSYFYLKGKERFGLSEKILPLSIIKTPNGLISDSQSFWAAIGWNVGHPFSLMSEYLAVDWFLQVGHKKYRLNKIRYNGLEKKTIISIGKENLNLESYYFHDGQLTEIAQDESLISSANLFRLEKDVNISSTDSIQLFYEFITPKNGQHNKRVNSNNSRWQKMDYILTGKYLIHKGELEDLKNDPDYKKYTALDSKTSICILKDRTWYFFVGQQTLEELVSLHRQKDCQESLMLDGGSSSTMVLKLNGHVEDVTKSLPRSQTSGLIRKITDGLIFYPLPKN